MSSSIKKKSKSAANSTTNVTELLMELVTVIFIFALFIVLPLGFRDYYYDIGEFKYLLFLVIFSAYIILMTILLIPYLVVHIKNGTWKGRKFKDWVKNLSIVDWFVLVYGIICVISFLGSEYHTFNFFRSAFNEEVFDNPAWYGFKDWWMGLRSQLSFVISYFYVSRFFVKDFMHFAYVIWIFVVLSFIFFLAIINRLGIDPFGFYNNLSDYYKFKFLTTLGQTSWYSSFLTTVIPLGVGFYYLSETKIQKVLYGIYLALGFMTLVSQDSDSAYMALAALVVTLLLVSFQSNRLMKNFIEIMLLLLIPGQFMGLLIDLFAKEYVKLGLDTFSQVFLFNRIIWVVVIILITAYIFIVKKENPDYTKTNSRSEKSKPFDINNYSFARYIVLGACGIFIVFIILVLVTATKNIIQLPESIPYRLKNYLIINNSWGNSRGGIWRLSKDMFKSFSPFKKLFGCGPDCYGYYVIMNFQDKILNYWYSETEYVCNAHNEWFNLYINTGLLGGTAYLGIFVSAFITFIKRGMNNNPLIFAAALSVISYIFHGIFCYQTVLNTPFTIIEIAMAMYLLRNSSAEDVN